MFMGGFLTNFSRPPGPYGPPQWAPAPMGPADGPRPPLDSMGMAKERMPHPLPPGLERNEPVVVKYVSKSGKKSGAGGGGKKGGGGSNESERMVRVSTYTHTYTHTHTHIHTHTYTHTPHIHTYTHHTHTYTTHTCTHTHIHTYTHTHTHTHTHTSGPHHLPVPPDLGYGSSCYSHREAQRRHQGDGVHATHDQDPGEIW